MAENKYADCLVQKPGPFPPELRTERAAEGEDLIPGIKATHLMTADGSVLKDYFFVDCTWLWSGASSEPVGEAHTHDFDHVIGLIGGYQDDPYDLDGEIIVSLDGNQETFTRSCLIFVPAGMKHLPLIFRRVDSPIFFWTASDSRNYGRTSGNEF